jgi:hypothetical protein
MLDNSLQLMNDDQGSGLSIYSCEWNRDMFWVIATSANYTEDWEWYFSKRESIKSKMSSEKRFNLLLKCSRSSDITAWNFNMHCVRNYKIQSVLDHLKTKFSSVCTPEQNTYVNELLLLWKKCLGWKQYILFKHSRFSMNMYKLCEGTFGILQSTQTTTIHLDTDTQNKKLSMILFFGTGKPSIT